MSASLRDQTLALAGIFQAASLVHETATKGQCQQEPLETTIQSLFQTDPSNTLDVYGDLYGLREGLKTLSRAMSEQPAGQDAQILRYSLSLVQLEARLRNQKDMMDTVGERIEQARRSVEHFGATHTNVLRNLASIYQDTLGTFRIKINVNGHRQYLEIEENAARIRACLLAGIRSAVLWRQLGGRRWQLIFRRKRHVAIADGILHDLN
ncbi:high frequency lysogenization protein HflD [Salicola sp. Rm-C-2C1-2]|uniref:high frequency lysogenization protein HflD n=1 Tax=Salicola sp. Rm-C-2C1-2 TaxID=3141321 RepID=UPI0032E4F079